MSGEILRKEYLERMEVFENRPDLIKIITGVRRSGKSTLLRQFRQKLISTGENCFYVNLEDMAYRLTTGRELDSYISEMMASDNDFVLLDEVQLVDGWEVRPRRTIEHRLMKCRIGPEIRLVIHPTWSGNIKGKIAWWKSVSTWN